MALSSASEPQLLSKESLGLVLDSFSEVKPQSVELPGEVIVMRACRGGVVATLAKGQMILITLLPEPNCYLMDSPAHHTGEVRDLAVSRDGEVAISAGTDGLVKVWNVAERREVVTFEGHTKGRTRAAITSDGRFGLSGGEDQLIKIWSLHDNSEYHTFEGHKRAIIRIIVTRSDKHCISGDYSGLIKVWDIENKQETATLTGHDKMVLCLVESEDGKQLWSGAVDKTIRVWDTDNWAQLVVFTGHTVGIETLNLIKQGQIGISSSWDKTIKLWSLAEKREIVTLEAGSNNIFCLTVFNNERFCLTGCFSGAIDLWDLENHSKIMSFANHRDIVRNIEVMDDNRHFLSGSRDRTIKIWSLSSRNEERTLSDLAESILVSSEYIVSFYRSEIKLWSWKESKVVAVLLEQSSINRIVLTPDHKYLLSGSCDNKVRLWDLEKRKLVHTFSDHQDWVFPLAVTPDGSQFISSAKDQTIKLWSIRERRLLESITLPSNTRIYSLQVCPDGNRFISSQEDGKIIIWTLADLKPLMTLTTGAGIITTTLCVAKDGKTLISGDNKAVRLWDLEKRQVMTTLFGHKNAVRNVALSFDERHIVSTSADKTVRVWSIEEKREVICYRGPTIESKVAVFTCDGNYVVFTGSDNLIQIHAFALPWEPSSTEQFEITSETVVIVTDLKLANPLSPLCAKTIIQPYNVNSLHISAFYNYPERCKEYLNMGVPILKGCFGSPLTVSLERKTAKCTNVFLRYLIDLADNVKGDAEWPTFRCINEDIPALLGCGSALLHPFFGILLQTPSSPPLPQFITPASPLPIVQFSESRLLSLESFDKSQKEEEPKLVNFWIGLIRWNTTPGSSKSLELLDALQDCEDKTVLTSAYATTLIEQKWEYFYPIILSLTLLYAVMLASLVMILFKVWYEFPLALVFIGLNAFFMLYELAQALASSSSYWLDVWNYMDLFRGFLSLFWGSLVLSEQEMAFLGADYQRDVRLVLAIMCLLRGFTYFRSFRMTRLFVYMTIAVVKEMYSFLIIMAYSVFAFGVCISILLEHPTIGISWTSAFSLVLGDFDTSTFGLLEWAIFSCAALTNIIIMLNLLVSILGDAYEKTQMSVRENDLFLMLGLVSEYESLMFWRRTAGTPIFILFCEGAQEAEITEEWAGLAVEIRGAMKEESHQVTHMLKSNFAELNQKTMTLQEGMKGIKGIESKLETMQEEIKKIKGIEGKLETLQEEIKGMKGIEGKLEAILGLLNSRS